MSFENRKAIISELQEYRGTKIVTHLNSDRRNVGQDLPALRTRLGTEAQPFFYQALQDLGSQEQIDLYLHTHGGQTDSVWPLVSLFREFTERFSVVIPFRAHSAGTLICLGADELVMGEAAELSPVDPQTGNQFNPVDEIREGNRKAISVEDVTSYFDFARDPAKEAESEAGTENPVDFDLAFEILAKEVHPLALGGVNRSHKQIRELAERLLKLHNTSNSHQKIVNTLTQGRYSHTDILNRREVIDLLGANVAKVADSREQYLMWELFSDYAESISLFDTFILQSEIGDEQQAEIELVGAFIETEADSYIYRSVCKVTQMSELPSNFNVQLQPNQLMPLIPGFPRRVLIEMEEQGWTRNDKGV